ncbi:hypothetical protein [Caballeronia sp. S22]|uniref:hypothetical protein n=1 Tax=Caballeronia sp. S22 TaxID=3137182 RepID=UPI0035311D7B
MRKVFIFDSGGSGERWTGCGEGVLETIANGAAGASVSGSNEAGTDDGSETTERVRAVVERLSANWPQDYPGEAVESLFLRESREQR